MRLQLIVCALLVTVAVSAARAEEACLIVMSTRGHDGLGDVLFGSHTDHVLRDAICPVLVTAPGAVPHR